MNEYNEVIFKMQMNKDVLPEKLRHSHLLNIPLSIRFIRSIDLIGNVWRQSGISPIPSMLSYHSLNNTMRLIIPVKTEQSIQQSLIQELVGEKT